MGFLFKRVMGWVIPAALISLGVCAFSVRLGTAQTASLESNVSPPQLSFAPQNCAGSSGLTQIVPGVYLYKDTCNVYAVVKGEAAVLIDFGSGGILDQLPSVGVRKVGWLLHTHYHRDQAQGFSSEDL